MMTRNEEDFIEEVLDFWSSLNIPLVVMDDSSDRTFEILQRYSNVYAFKQEEVYGTGISGSGDRMFQAILEKKRQLFGINDYVCLAMGDELWWHDPLKICEDMRNEEAVFGIMHSCQFFLHTTDKDKWDFEKGEWKPEFAHLKNSERLRWYSPSWLEGRIFYDDGICHYEPDQAFCTLPLSSNGKQYSKHPTLRHYPLRNPIQVIARAKDRVERGYQPVYEHSYQKEQEQVFFETFPKYKISAKFETDFGINYEIGLEDLLYKGGISNSIFRMITNDVRKDVDYQDVVNVITPTYNRVNTLRCLLEDISRQRMDFVKSIVVHVVADGKDDKVQALVNDFNRKVRPNIEIRYYHMANHAGFWAGPSRRAVVNSLDDKGYICFIDDDNRIEKAYIDTMVYALKENNVDFGYCKIFWRGSCNVEGTIIPPNQEFARSMIDPLSCMTKTSIAKRNIERWSNVYDSDWDFWESCYKENKQVAFVDAVLAYHGYNDITNTGEEITMIQDKPIVYSTNGQYTSFVKSILGAAPAAPPPPKVPSLEEKLQAAEQGLRENNSILYDEVLTNNVYAYASGEAKDKIVFDIGANIGLFSFWMAKEGAKKVLAYEPYPENAEVLEQYLSDVPTIQIIRKAIYDKNGVIFMNGENVCAKVADTGIALPCITLHQMLEDHGEDRNDLLLKIDCEGAEYDIFFASSKEDISRFEIIYAEVHHKIHARDESTYVQYSMQSLVDYLAYMGFRKETDLDFWWKYFDAEGNETSHETLARIIKFRRTS